MVLSFGGNLEITGFSYPISLMNFTSLEVKEEAYGSLPTARLVIKHLQNSLDLKPKGDMIEVSMSYDGDTKLKGKFKAITETPISKPINKGGMDMMIEQIWDLVGYVDIKPKSVSTKGKIEEHLKKMGVDTDIETEDKSIFINPNRPEHYHIRDLLPQIKSENPFIPSFRTDKVVVRDTKKALDKPKAKISIAMSKSGYEYADSIDFIPQPLGKLNIDPQISVNDKSQNNESMAEGNLPPQYSNGDKPPSIYKAHKDYLDNANKHLSDLYSLRVDRTSLYDVGVGDAVTIASNLEEESNFIIMSKTVTITDGGVSTTLIVSGKIDDEDNEQ